MRDFITVLNGLILYRLIHLLTGGRSRGTRVWNGTRSRPPAAGVFVANLAQPEGVVPRALPTLIAQLVLLLAGPAEEIVVESGVLIALEAQLHFELSKCGHRVY